jgi:integrase/recombinase XerD
MPSCIGLVKAHVDAEQIAHIRDCPVLKEPQMVLPTFTTAQVQRLIGWKPRRFYERRLRLLVLVLLDTGCRITEALTLRVRDFDLDNLLVTLDGKGRKQRVVPFFHSN